MRQDDYQEVSMNAGGRQPATKCAWPILEFVLN
jgi:hypothetical protein